MHYQQLGPVRPPPMAMGMAYPAGPAAFYPQGLMAQPAFAPIAGYMAPAAMAGAYPVAYAPYPGGVPAGMQAYAAAPMFGAPMQHMAAMQQQWAHAAPMAPPRPPPPPHHPPPPPADERGA
jgi:hypothetical protein